MFNRRALKAYEQRLEKKKPIEKKDKLSLGLASTALIVSTLALSASLITLYYNVLKLSDEIRVVFEQVPAFTFGKEQSELHAGRPFSVIFINSGNRPAIVSDVTLYLWESAKPVDENLIHQWDCSTNDGRKGKRTLSIALEPIILREKEIVRTELAYRNSEATGDDDDDDGTIKLPFPEWVKAEGEYWVTTCILFTLVTPSTSYAQGSVALSNAIGFNKKVSFYGDVWLDTSPYLIWKNTEMVFSR